MLTDRMWRRYTWRCPRRSRSASFTTCRLRLGVAARSAHRGNRSDRLWRKRRNERNRRNKPRWESDDAGGATGNDGGLSGDDGGSSFGNDGGGTNPGSGAPTTCIVGTQGCLCDSSGSCAPNLTCTPQTVPQPSLCCSGSDCTSSTGGSIGKSCSAVSGAPSCTPGITIPPATGSNDSCGYPASSFVESATICAINAVGGGAKPAIIQVFYNDEHALTLGCATSSDPVSPLSAVPDAVHYPQTGDPACVDTVGRLLRPVLYVTDTSDDPTCTAGDQQKGGPAYNPTAIFGTWKSASEGDAGNVGTPEKADPAKNTWNLTSSADPLPAAATVCNRGIRRGAAVRSGRSSPGTRTASRSSPTTETRTRGATPARPAPFSAQGAVHSAIPAWLNAGRRVPPSAPTGQRACRVVV